MDLNHYSALSSQSSTTVSHPSSSQSGQSSSEGTLVVDVKGAVKQPGVYELAYGSRVTDAIKKAGGFQANANQKSVNLAQKLQDEAVIYVASQGEAVSEVISASTGTASETNTVISIDASDKKINLNTATVADLQTISGIGQKRAQDIIAYRDSKGGFTSVDDLKEVSGIGDKTFEKIKDAVTVD
ncbi:Late competence protein ComEA, DNA receptor [Streptococcus sp. DD12]|nr:Late competence protein ComEA, DNA receptor [Streptococcus sp. DD12]